MREGQIFGRQRPGRQPGKAFGFQPGKAVGFGRQGRVLEERPKPGSQTPGAERNSAPRHVVDTRARTQSRP
jgi:hypothetical protein